MFNVHHRRQINLQDQLAQDKENVLPPSPKLNNNSERLIDAIQLIRGKWTNKTLEKFMDAIENKTSLKKASRHWNIPLTSLLDYLNGKT
jgi:hypothetical protein